MFSLQLLKRKVEQRMNNMMGIFMQLMQSQNPMAMMMQMFGKNPAMQRAMQMMNGKTPEQMQQVVMNMSKEAGIDPNFINQFVKK